MKFKKLMGLFMVSSLAVGSLVGCGDKETNADTTPVPTQADTPDPTKAPDPTDAPEPTKAPDPTPTDAPTPTPVPEKDPNTIFDFNADQKSQALYFNDRGNGTARWRNTGGHDSDECFLISNRGDSWHGVSLTIPDEYIGKVLHVSYWAKHENPDPITISCTLQITKPDGTNGWPERANNEAVPSNEWTFIEGDIAVYADVTKPIISWEATDTLDFYIDDVLVTLVEGAVAEAQYQDLVVDKPDLSGVESISLTFNDENLFFGNRGDGTPAIVAGGHDDDFAMQVTGRSSNWHGAQVDLTDYSLAGRTINISYWVKTEETTEVNVTLQEDFSDGSDTAYNRVASSGDIAPGEWVQVTGTIEVGANTSKPILYFESPSDTASFTVDEVVISFSGAGSAPAAGNGQTLSFTFADGNVFFTPFGSGTPAIVSGGHDDDFAMQVTGRTASWNGASADLASYNAIGRTVSISYYVKTEEAIEVNVTLNGEKDGEATYNRLAASGEVAPGEWVQVTGSIEVPADYTKCVIYFESPSETANFTIDEVVITIE